MSSDTAVVSPQREVRDAMRRSTDPRSLRTRAAIVAAVHEIAAEQTGTVPTVAEIIRRAGVSRSSFYTQFSDFGELVEEVLRQALESIRREDAGLRQIPNVTEAEATRLGARHVIEHVIAHREFYRLGLATGGAALWGSVTMVAEQLAASECVKHGPSAGVSVPMAATFLAGGLLTLLHAVVREEAEPDLEEITGQFVAMLPDWLFGDGYRQGTAGQGEPARST